MDKKQYDLFIQEKMTEIAAIVDKASTDIREKVQEAMVVIEENQREIDAYNEDLTTEEPAISFVANLGDAVSAIEDNVLDDILYRFDSEK